MKRLAVLIGSPSDPNTPKAGQYLRGVNTDINNIYNFLKSSIGGSWQDNEIKSFVSNPGYNQVAPFLKACESVDFAFVYFSGHGYTDSQNNARVLFNQNESPYVDHDLANRSARQITIIDACRNYQPVGLGDLSLLEGIDFPNHNPGFARFIYDDYISKLPYSRALLYATTIGNSSMDYGSNVGGLFSTNLLNVLKYKYETEFKEVFKISDVFTLTQFNTQNHIPNQHPEIYVSNDNAYELPLGVKSIIQPKITSHQMVNENLMIDITKGVLFVFGIVVAGKLLNAIFSEDKK